VDAKQKWELELAYAIKSAFKRYAKKHRAEYASCFENLDRVHEILCNGHSWGSFQVGFLRTEGDGLFRVGQTGVAHARETRLYIHVDEAARRIHVLTIGDKDSQQDDIRDARKIVGEIRKKMDHEDKEE